MRTKSIIAIVAVLIVAGLSVLMVGASSHNDAPLIHEDPYVNNTDVYAFVSPANPDSVTLISNFIPMPEPGDGPTFSRFSDRAVYDIRIDVNGDAREDLTYQFRFTNNIANGNTFLYNLGEIGAPANPTDPSSPYTNLNVQQYFTLTEVLGTIKGYDDGGAVLLSNARVAPANVGPQSTPDYNPLADFAIHSFSFAGGVGKAFVGPRDEGFYVDLMAAFDLLGGFTDPQRDPVDTFSGFNVYSLALEIPKARLAAAGDTDGIIGVWSTASRPQTTIVRPSGTPRTTGKEVQVSRLGNPLINELLLPLHAKDRFNASHPKDDVANGFADFITDPGTTQGGAALIPLIAGLTSCTPTNGRIDLDLALLKGIDAGTADALDNAIPSLAPFTSAGGNQDTQNPGGPVRSDMLRLNYNVSPSSSPSPLGFFGGDPAGFPNGRRVGDDVVDIYLKAGAGGILHALGAISCPVSLSLSDGVQENDAPYNSSFPYLATPHQGYDHLHEHGFPVSDGLALGLGSGLLAAGIAMGAVLTVRRRRNSKVS